MRNSFLLIILALLSFALLFFVKSKERALQNTIYTENKAQEYMTDVFLTIYTEEGLLKNKLSANYWAYLPDARSSTLTTPHLTIYKPDGSLWTIDAERGVIKQPNIGTLEQIVLNKNVIIKRPASGTIVPITLETDELLYQPDKQYAESDKFVSMTKPGLKISGTGMRAHLDQGSVELLHDVKTSYTGRISR